MQEPVSHTAECFAAGFKVFGAQVEELFPDITDRLRYLLFRRLTSEAGDCGCNRPCF